MPGAATSTRYDVVGGIHKPPAGAVTLALHGDNKIALLPRRGPAADEAALAKAAGGVP